jgi:hypothetical protein
VEGYLIVAVILLSIWVWSSLDDKKNPKPDLTEEELGGIVFMDEPSDHE